MISLIDIYIKLGGRPILKGVNLQIVEGECLAVVGPNGCGKSTLLRYIAGIDRADKGNINLPNKATVGYLPQEANLEVEHSLEEELLSVFSDIHDALDQMKDLEHKMGELDPESPQYLGIAEEYSRLSHYVEHKEGYSIGTRAEQVATGLGFGREDMYRSCLEFSGGWQMRILLAKLLLKKPDILLLDEPTNHLDLESTLWLEEWIRNCGRTVVMVSHERALMDRLASRIVCLEMGTAEIYKGNYSDYLKQSELKRQKHRDEYERQQKEIAQVQAFINKFRYNNKKASLVQSRIKMLEKIERIPPPFYGSAIHFDFPPAPHSYKEVVALENVGHSYGEKKVLSGIDLTIYRGEKVGLVGVNGAGKSTLLRIIAGKFKPTEGEFTLGRKVVRAFFDQYDTQSLESGATLLEELESRAPLGEASRSRDLLGAFLFTGDDVDKPLKALSGGERTRFRLAELLFSPANLLLLDEPTNHLDITSRTTVEKALKNFNGTVIVVSHDRVFMDRVTDRVVELDHGQLRIYPGRYNDYLEHKKNLVVETGESTKPMKITSDKSQRILEREEKKAREREIRTVRRKLESVELEIHEQEKKIEELDKLMSGTDVITDYAKLSKLGDERKEIEKAYGQNLELWEELGNELEDLEL